MTRSIIDHAEQAAEGARMRQFLEIDRRGGMHPAVDALVRRPAERSEAKVREFLRIDREEARRDE
ncbi:hypothetical protein FBT96_13360 [Rhodobacter capsulatus]|uniref:Uncharacterized protein n=1 Tax=Rhodobacter capsulatus TaxID=1061 RepID=A0A4U1JP36_RHOCA|nr:hypothetical protein [Rhodobacter capsulatus]TKD17692.1 hypothetical protein FBT96_13360 [Rhodobacter capsulatus]